MRLPRLLFVRRFCFFLPQGWLKNGRHSGVLLRLYKGAKKRPGIQWSAKLFLFFYFLDSCFNRADTTRTQMYLLSVMIYHEPSVCYNLFKPPSLLLSSLTSSPRGCPATGSRWRLPLDTRPFTEV